MRGISCITTSFFVPPEHFAQPTEFGRSSVACIVFVIAMCVKIFLHEFVLRRPSLIQSPIKKTREPSHSPDLHIAYLSLCRRTRDYNVFEFAPLAICTSLRGLELIQTLRAMERERRKLGFQSRDNHPFYGSMSRFLRSYLVE